jgi:hypothetical protein
MVYMSLSLIYILTIVFFNLSSVLDLAFLFLHFSDMLILRYSHHFYSILNNINAIFRIVESMQATKLTTY